MNKYDTLKVVFAEPVKEVNKMFEEAPQSWGVSTVKEWIEGYESSRFTQIDEYTAIITSEYNMEYIEQWLRRNIDLKSLHYQTIKTMTQEDCKKVICELLTSSELNKVIDSLINTRLVAEMLKHPTLKDYVPRAVLSAAIQSEYNKFRPLSETGQSIESELIKLL